MRIYLLKISSIISVGLAFCLFFLSCHNSSIPDPVMANYTLSSYSSIQLIVQPDTLNFKLNEKVYNDIKSFNYFVEGFKAYMSFYDRKSESVVLYDFQSRQLVKVLPMKKILKRKELIKASVYTHNFDSIFIMEYASFYRLDSSGKIKRKVPFINERESLAFFETRVPVIAHNGVVHAGVRAWVNTKELKDIRNWKILYSFDLKNKERELHYRLPALYRKDLFGKQFLEYSYCFNEKNNFVFSFPADTLIYETDLKDHHVAYYAKCKDQDAPIEPVNKEALEKDEGRREATLRYFYGPIYFDPYTKRYLRFVKHKVSKEAYESGKYNRKITVIVMNQDFKVIGEFDYNKDYDYETLFFTKDGGIYARVNYRDENALHFVRLAWSKDPKETMPLTKK